MAQTTQYISATPTTISATFLAGEPYNTGDQTLNILANYAAATVITIPYTGNSVPQTSSLAIDITSGSNTRALALTTDYTVDDTTSGQLVITILANRLATTDANANGFVVATLSFNIVRTIS